MTEVCAAMGLTSLEAMESIVAINRRNYETYQEGLHDLPGVSLIAYDAAELNSYQYLVVELDPNLAPLTRDELVAVMHAENVLARKYFWPGCHRMEPYRSLQPNAGRLLPNTERVAARVMLLPTGQTVTLNTIDAICEIIRTAFLKADEVRKALAREPQLSEDAGELGS
jgi:dTDP-4-amino-4,6-dideoxygalactose transaminase